MTYLTLAIAPWYYWNYACNITLLMASSLNKFFTDSDCWSFITFSHLRAYVWDNPIYSEANAALKVSREFEDFRSNFTGCDAEWWTKVSMPQSQAESQHWQQVNKPEFIHHDGRPIVKWQNKLKLKLLLNCCVGTNYQCSLLTATSVIPQVTFHLAS